METIATSGSLRNNNNRTSKSLRRLFGLTTNNNGGSNNNTPNLRQHIKREMDEKLKQIHIQSEKEESFTQTLRKMPAASMSPLRANALGLSSNNQMMMTFRDTDEIEGGGGPQDQNPLNNSTFSISSSSSSSLHGSVGRIRKTSHHSIWYQRYKQERDQLWAERLKKYEVNDMAQKGWKRGLVKKKAPPVIADVEIEPPPPLVPWHRNAWPANFFCELCMGVAPTGADVLSCSTCNVVFHCACYNHKQGGSKEDELKLRSKNFHCTHCDWVIKNELESFEEYKRQRRGASLRYKMIVKLQSVVRGWLVRQRYTRFLARLAQAQAIIRRYVIYRRFRRFVRTVTRLYRVRVIDIVDLCPLELSAPSSNFSIMLSIINVKRSSSIFGSPLLKRGSVSAAARRRRSTVTATASTNTLRGDDGKRHKADLDAVGQLYRFESTPFPHGDDVHLNQTFYVPGCSSSVTMAFTVVRNGVIQEFWGQGFIEASSLPGSRKTRVSIPLGEMKFAPRENKSLVPIKNRVLADQIVTGHVIAEIHQIPSYHCKCGFIHEVPKTGNKHEKVKTWWMALIESHLFLYKNAGDSIPYQMITVLKASLSDGVNIRVSSLKGDDAILFTHPDETERQDWYNKIKNATKSD